MGRKKNVDEADSAIRAELQARLDAKGWTFTQLADESGVSRSTITRYFGATDDIRFPDWPEAHKLIKTLYENEPEELREFLTRRGKRWHVVIFDLPATQDGTSRTGTSVADDSQPCGHDELARNNEALRERLTQQTEAHAAEARGLQEQSAHAVAEAEKLRQALAASERSVRNFKLEAADLRGQVEQSHRSARAELTEYEQALDLSEERQRELGEQKAELAERLVDAEGVSAKRWQLVAQLRSDADRHRTTERATQEEVRALNAELDELRASTRRAEDAAAAAEDARREEVGRLRQHLEDSVTAAMDAKVASEADANSAARLQAYWSNRLVAEVDHYKGLLQQAQDLARVLRGERDYYRGQRDQLRGQSLGEVAELRRKVQALLELKDKVQAIPGLQNQVLRLRGEMDGVHAQIQELTANADTASYVPGGRPSNTPSANGAEPLRPGYDTCDLTSQRSAR